MGQDYGFTYESRSRLGADSEVSQSSCYTSEESESRNRRYHQLKCSESNSGDLSLDRIPNFHCKSLPTRCRKTNAEQSIVGKRGSMYQSSSEISRIRKIQEGRRKVDSAFDGDAFLSFDIVDSFSQPSTSGAYLHSHQNRRSGAKASVETARKVHRASRDFLDLSFRELPDDNFKIDRPRLDCTLLKNDGDNGFLEISLEKEVTKGPCRNAAPHLLDIQPAKDKETNYQNKTSENNCDDRERDSASSSKSMPAKVSSFNGSHLSESVHHVMENNTKARSSPFKKILDPIMKSKSLRSPSLMEKGDSNSITVPVSRKDSMSRKSLLSDFSRTEQGSCHPNGKLQHVMSALSPAHLQAVLKLDSRNVGKDGSVNNSVVTEFVSYDIAHAKRALEEKTQCTETSQPPLSSVVDKPVSGESPQRINLLDQQKIARNNSDVSTFCPWSEEDLYPHLEIAATVIKIPFNKGSKSKEMKNGSSPCTVKVVTPSGLHGLPSDNEACPSPLLDRWRYGGGCDCGGWDMACPIVILGNAYDDNWAESITINAKHPMELFIQGSKEELPALSMKANGKGQFLVDFHGRLSALQAFSVCISLLHCSEALMAISLEKGKHKLHSSSLKMLLEEDVRHLIEAVTAKEKKPKRREKTPPTVLLDPPFSPIGRV
ncbi:hypothetical protein PR202_gb18287 [Eleusine coracana subsp. coracana]|uniref:Uncharacterized protein n=1 Tax=Eleusine coracana subsp. coracana TaxID=191504 RepID=A0AAV5F2W3_ELECO|nr:hypothetical protein PR202_gb18287 [Eleusine coracana subsp. coracana]